MLRSEDPGGAAMGRGSTPCQLHQPTRTIWLFPIVHCLQLADLEGVVGTQRRTGI